VNALRRRAPEPVSAPGVEPVEEAEELEQSAAEQLAGQAEGLDNKAKAILVQSLSNANELSDEALREAVTVISTETGRPRSSVAREVAKAAARLEAFTVFLSTRGLPTQESIPSRRRWQLANDAAEWELEKIERKLARLSSDPNSHTRPLVNRQRRLRAQRDELLAKLDRYHALLHPAYAGSPAGAEPGEPATRELSCSCGVPLDRHESFLSGGMCDVCLRAGRLAGFITY
jgi:hypothetical protein